MIQGKRNFFKIRVALFFGYNGKGYHGSQSQKDPLIKTVEKSLFEGLIDSKLISETHMGELKKAGWGRGARTDKGVHALCNGVNVKLAISEEYLMKGSPLHMAQQDGEELQKEIDEKNKALMEQEVYRKSDENNENKEGEQIQQEEQTQQKDAQEQQQATETVEGEVAQENKEQNEKGKITQEQMDENRRKKQELKDQHRQMQEFANERRKQIDVDKIINTLNSNLPDDIRAVSVKQVTRKFDIRTHCKYRVYEYLMPMFMYQKYEDIMNNTPITEEFEKQVFEKVTALAMKFKGTHNFHNYTRQMKAKDPRCLRYILDMQTEIVVNPTNGMKFIRFTLHGQSFIYHQIRKMMGMICMMVSEDYPESFFETSFFHNVVRIWLAPAHGLFLNRMRFDGYNKKPEIPEPIEFDAREEDRLLDMRLLIEKAIMNEDDVNAVYKQWVKDMKEGREIVEENESVSGDQEG